MNGSSLIMGRWTGIVAGTRATNSRCLGGAPERLESSSIEAQGKTVVDPCSLEEVKKEFK